MLNPEARYRAERIPLADSIIFYDPKAFTAYQGCDCHNSQMVDDVSIEDGRLEGDIYKATMVSRPMVCSICKTPYRVMVDTRRVGMITNIGVE